MTALLRVADRSRSDEAGTECFIAREHQDREVSDPDCFARVIIEGFLTGRSLLGGGEVASSLLRTRPTIRRGAWCRIADRGAPDRSLDPSDRRQAGRRAGVVVPRLNPVRARWR